jgi:hypothetical protein
MALDDLIQASTSEVTHTEGLNVDASQESTSGNPPAMPFAPPQTIESRRRGSAKCTSCLRSKKGKYKVCTRIEDFLTSSAKLILVIYAGHVWIARGREDTCDKVPGLSIRRRPSHRSVTTNGYYEQLRNDVDSLKLSFDDFKNTVTTSIDSIHSILL